MKNINYKIDFATGCACLENGQKKTIYLTREGAYFRLGLRKIWLKGENQ